MEKKIADIAVRYLANEASAEEKTVLMQWLKASAENERLFFELLVTRNLTRRPEQVQPDTQNAWERVKGHILTSPDRKSGLLFQLSRSTLLKIAACIIVAMGTLITVLLIQTNAFRKGEPRYSTVESFRHGKSVVTLPDGTKVVLNEGSRIKYLPGYSKKSREVFLSGQAYFEVTKDAQKPFIVSTSEGFKVMVLGTSFDVSAYAGDTSISVALVEGLVRIDAVNEDGKEVTTQLKPGKMLTYNKHTKKMTSSGFDAGILLRWKNKELAFENDSFKEVIGGLEEWYGIRVQVAGERDKRRYTFKIRDESLEEALFLFGKLAPIDYEVKDGQVFIRIKN